MRHGHLLGVRFTNVLVSLLFFLIWKSQAVGETRSYEARIITPGAPVLSGPGENYYPTDTLPQGEIVEVYREHSGGWLGIRPPQDSFSWVFARHVKRLDSGLAEIENDDVPSRIGSRMNDQRNAVQIRLKKGEVVEIVGEQSFDGQAWYKIAPPAGEFRWIHVRNAARTDQAPQVEPAAPAAHANLPPIVTVAATSTSTSSSDVPPVTPAGDPQPAVQQDWRAAPVEGATSDTAAPPLAGETVASGAPTSAAEATAAQPAPSTSPNAASPPPLAVEELDRQLTSIELRLSRIVSEPPASWQIESLAREVEQLLAQAKTVDERRAVQSTLAKVDRFAAIGRRYRGAPTAVTSPGQPPITPIGQSPIMPIGQPPITPLADSQQPTAESLGYDAVGILRPVVSKRAGAPQLALVNSAARSCRSSPRRLTSTCSRTSATALASLAAAATSRSFNGPTSLQGVLRRWGRIC
jgi:hypothetical protein